MQRLLLDRDAVLQRVDGFALRAARDQRSQGGLEQSANLVNLSESGAVSGKIKRSVLGGGLDRGMQHRRTAACSPPQLNQRLRFQYPQRLSQRGPRDTQLRQQVRFRWQRVTRLELPAGDLCAEQLDQCVRQLLRWLDPGFRKPGIFQTSVHRRVSA